MSAPGYFLGLPLAGLTLPESPLAGSWLYELLAPGRSGALPWLIGLAGSLGIGLVARRKRALTRSGAAAAGLVGTLLFALGSLVWFAVLVAFFASSTAFTLWKKHLRSEAEGSYEKSGTRDAGQVFANGLAGAGLCVLNAIRPDPLWLAAYLGVMASVTADTWATELGGLSRARPRSIRTGRPVPAGTSGGVTWLGTLAGAAGAVFIGGAAVVCLWLVPEPHQPAALAGLARLAAFAALGGIAGSAADSLLGATLQRRYRCPVCGRTVERREHCGQPTRPSGGWSRMNNDAVNVLSSLAGGALAVLLAAAFR
ncbi:DUF92 domain-containing protein [Gorillibacterium sp. sgz500922]|uniref:DUF92 domain-containing protein n=1 Tax=Gorillibacterium sp. sgz500922 TaxID=3446694 RepID=UPI003F66BFD3